MRVDLLVALTGYFFLLLFVGVFFSRKTRSLEDYFLASRNLGSLLVFLSLAASWIGASSTLVTVDEAYSQGISSFWVMGVPAVLTALGFAFIFAGPIRRLPILTLPDLVEMRYGRLVRHLASFLIVWYMILLAASQMVALGSFLGTLLRIPYFQALLFGTAVVVVYSVIGGFFSVVLTDSLQFLLLVGGIVGLFFFLAGRTSFAEAAAVALRGREAGFWDFFQGWERHALMVVSFVCAWTISPIVWQRIQAARTPRHARRGLLAAALAFLVIYSVIVCIGILGLPLFPDQELDGPLLSLMVSSVGALLSGLLFVAVAAAIMSTLDTAINTGALSLTRDVIQRLLKGASLMDAPGLGRISTIIIAALALLVATRFQSILQALGLASEILAEGFFIPGIAMLFLRRRAPSAGLLSVSLGGGYAVLVFLVALGLLPLPLPEWPFSIPYGLGLSLVGFLVGFAWDRKRSASALRSETNDI
ncbi:MAG: sodium:solute symporter [Candidatus Aminicenantaceae bacterium]